MAKSTESSAVPVKRPLLSPAHAKIKKLDPVCQDRVEDRQGRRLPYCAASRKPASLAVARNCGMGSSRAPAYTDTKSTPTSLFLRLSAQGNNDPQRRRTR